MSNVTSALALGLRDISWIKRLREGLTSQKSHFITAGTKQDPQEVTEPFVTRIIGDEHCSPAFSVPTPRTIGKTRNPIVEQDLQGSRMITRTVTTRQAIFEERSMKLRNVPVDTTVLPEVGTLLNAFGSVLRDFRLCRLLQEASRHTPRENLNVELKEIFESYINRLLGAAAFIKLDVPLDLLRHSQRWLVTQLTSEASRFLDSTEVQAGAGSGLCGDEDQERDCGRSFLHNYLSNTGPRRQQSDLNALDAWKDLLLEDEPFENMCEDIKDMILRHNPSEVKAIKTNDVQDDVEKECEDVTSSRRIGHEVLDTADFNLPTESPMGSSSIDVLVRLSRSIYDKLYPVKAGRQRVRWRCVSTPKAMFCLN